MYDYVIVHASFGHPFEHWYSWLFDELTKRGKNVLVPQFPCGIDAQNFDNWSKVLDSYRPFLNENTSYIGHSIGPAFIVSYLVKNNLKCKNGYFVAPVYDKIEVPDYDHVNSTFFKCEDLGKMATLSQKCKCYISDTDPYVPNRISEDFSANIHAEKEYVHNAGHFNTMAGYLTFEQLLSDILGE